MGQMMIFITYGTSVDGTYVGGTCVGGTSIDGMSVLTPTCPSFQLSSQGASGDLSLGLPDLPHLAAKLTGGLRGPQTWSP